MGRAGIATECGSASRVTRAPLWVKLGHSAMSVQCPVCKKADTAAWRRGGRVVARGARAAAGKHRTHPLILRCPVSRLGSSRWSMIRKSAHRFSEKIMLKQRDLADERPNRRVDLDHLPLVGTGRVIRLPTSSGAVLA